METISKAEQLNWPGLTPGSTAANGTEPGRRLSDGFSNELQPNETPPAWTSSLADQPKEAAGGKQTARCPPAVLRLLSAGEKSFSTL